jgi:hypothetical protein
MTRNLDKVSRYITNWGKAIQEILSTIKGRVVGNIVLALVICMRDNGKMT